MNRAMLQNGETLFDRSSRGNLAGGVLKELHWHGFNRLKLPARADGTHHDKTAADMRPRQSCHAPKRSKIVSPPLKRFVNPSA